MALGEKLRELRKARGLSLEELGRRVGTSKSYVWEIENRENANPGLERIQQFADALGVSMSDLIDDGLDTNNTEFRALFRMYGKMDKSKQRQINKLMRMLSGE